MSLLLLKPKYLSIRNSIIKRDFYSAANARDGIIVTLALAMMYLIYRGVVWAITHINANPSLMYLPPGYPLGMILALLFFMLCISGIAVAIGSLFLAEDLDLILATPVSKGTLYFGKLLYIIVHASWMPLLFISPLMIAFGRSYDAPLSFYPLSLLLLLPFFILAGSLSSIFAILISKIVPANRSREVLILIVIACCALLYVLLDLLHSGLGSNKDPGTLSRLVSFLSLANISWLPSHWTAVCLEDAILQRSGQWVLYLPLLLFATLTAVSLAQITFLLFHFETYTRSRSIKSLVTYRTDGVRRFLSLLKNQIHQAQRALMGKEILNFTRDVTHTIQLLMLLGLCAVYIFNLRIFLNVDAFPADSRDWWQKFFFISNASIAAFVTTGFCTRFVYVSLSLEGKSLWILQTSPLSLEDILNAKFRCWYLPVALLGSVVFCAAGLSLNMGSGTLVVSMLCAWLICYGIVGLAVGLGARYANFNWEHSSQLAAGFGNMVFMLASVSLISLNLVPACVMLFSKNESLRPILIGCMLLTIAVINLAAKRLIIDFGAKSLLKRQELHT